MARDDLVDPDDIYTPEKFREYVDVLEAVRELLGTQTHARVRLALVALDGLAEAFMFRLCSELFSRDEFYARIVPPRFSRKQKNAASFRHPAKLSLLREEGLIGSEDVAVLDVAHGYRNRAVHHDVHNPRAGLAISALLIGAVGRLFGATGAGVTIGGFKDGDLTWIAKYGLSTTSIELGPAAARIAAVVGEGLPLGKAEVQRALLGDLHERLVVLEAFPGEQLFGLSGEALNELLLEVEFRNSFDESAIAANYREAVYAIGAGQAYSRDEFGKRQEEYEAAMCRARENFRPTLGLTDFQSLSRFVGPVRQARGTKNLLEAYGEADFRFAAYESAMLAGRRLVEGAGEFLSDLERGA